MTRVIINADDLGYSLEINRRIEAAIVVGAITSSTIMANGPAFDDAVRISKQYPQISFGVHLNIIEFKPICHTDVFNKYDLLNSSGEFKEGAIYALTTITDELQDAIFDEFAAQIDKVRDAGVRLSHIDSHQHTHTIYSLRYTIVKLMNEYQLNKVRRCRIPSIRLMLWGYKGPKVILDKSKAVAPKKKNVLYRRIYLFVVKYQCWSWIRLFRRKGKITDAFYAYQMLCENWNILRRDVEGKCIELMCHPGHPAYEHESQMVLRKQMNKMTDIELITYNDL